MNILAMRCIAILVAGLPLVAMHSEKDQFERLSAYCLQKMQAKTTFMLCERTIKQNICLVRPVRLKPVDMIKAVTEALNSNPQIHELVLTGLPFDLESAQQIADFFLTNTTLKRLELHENAMSEEGYIAVATALKTNSSLETFRCQSNLVKSSTVRTMCEMLATSTTLQNLSAFGASIEDADWQSIIKALRENYSLIGFGCNRHATSPHLCEEIIQIKARNKVVAHHQREKLEIIYCITSPPHFFPYELMHLLIIAYYNALPTS